MGKFVIGVVVGVVATCAASVVGAAYAERRVREAVADSLGENKKSVAFSLSIRQGEKPLAETEISPIVDRVLQAEISTLGASLRA